MAYIASTAHTFFTAYTASEQKLACLYYGNIALWASEQKVEGSGLIFWLREIFVIGVFGKNSPKSI